MRRAARNGRSTWMGRAARRGRSTWMRHTAHGGRSTWMRRAARRGRSNGMRRTTRRSWNLGHTAGRSGRAGIGNACVRFACRRCAAGRRAPHRSRATGWRRAVGAGRGGVAGAAFRPGSGGGHGEAGRLVGRGGFRGRAGEGAAVCDLARRWRLRRGLRISGRPGDRRGRRPGHRRHARCEESRVRAGRWLPDRRRLLPAHRLDGLGGRRSLRAAGGRMRGRAHLSRRDSGIRRVGVRGRLGTLVEGTVAPHSVLRVLGHNVADYQAVASAYVREVLVDRLGRHASMAGVGDTTAVGRHRSRRAKRQRRSRRQTKPQPPGGSAGGLKKGRWPTRSRSRGLSRRRIRLPRRLGRPRRPSRPG